MCWYVFLFCLVCTVCACLPCCSHCVAFVLPFSFSRRFFPFLSVCCFVLHRVVSLCSVFVLAFCCLLDAFVSILVLFVFVGVVSSFVDSVSPLVFLVALCFLVCCVCIVCAFCFCFVCDFDPVFALCLPSGGCMSLSLFGLRCLFEACFAIVLPLFVVECWIMERHSTCQGTHPVHLATCGSSRNEATAVGDARHSPTLPVLA